MPQPDALHVARCDDPVAAFVDAHRHQRSLALPTSGTSQRPRTVVRTTDSWVDSFEHVARLLGLDARSRVWIPGPLASTMNLFAAVHADWAGATRVDGPAGATHAHLTPSALRQRLASDPADLAGVHVLVAGDRLDPTTYAAALAAGVDVSHYYGAAELSFVAWGDHADELRPFPGVEVEARHGELWVRSPYVCDGYLEPDRSLRRDDDGWTTVGDRGVVDDGRVVVLGRGGGITTGGATVVVADIEALLRRGATGEVAVVGLPHPDLGAVVAAVVTRDEDLPALRDLARHDLEPAQRPRRWFHLDALPVTEAGKVDRDALLAALTTDGVA
ncbi:AMP-binding enzyme [Nocardioides currus]|uniref:O-succinylbenzoate--CoA ligase n=1 Tax=Nocardioides currus TaxID=2133958 RepID=A0A2R7YUG1_9ACTN|nr:AMP-binding protein [Nocardioides currus]PUA80012.1 o-succinylbenzoate--CoA ligase [Nocardioides currus]